MTWMLQGGQNKDTECNEIRNFLLNVIVVTRVKRNQKQTALMDYGNHLPHPTARRQIRIALPMWHICSATHIIISAQRGFGQI